MSRSRSRLAADWFAKLRINAQTQEVEHEDVADVKEEVDTEKADLSYVDNAIDNIEGVPAGVILMWSGSVSSIPAGWHLCNGSNGTPNLTDRFVYGAASDGEVNTTGGSANAVAVSHSHSGSAASAGSHSHSGSTNTTGNHTHRVYHATNDRTGSYINERSSDKSSYYTNTSAAGNHSHTVSINSGGSHSHSVTVNASGESGTNKNLPPYMKLAYIMKG